uniref:Subtilisin-like protease fibronectin type-III domain-containing protein n=1 Tax=Brassica campestris TaxID=3711 RepID=M4EAI8_BRACM
MKAAKSEGSIFSAASDKDNIAFSVSFPFDSSSTDKDNIAASTAPTPFDLSSSLSLFDLLRNLTTIKTISKSVPENFTCPEDSKLDLISTVNYPSIGISGYKGNENKTVSRTATNVGGDGVAVYTVSVETPPGFSIQVTPEKLQFTKDGEKLTYQVTVSAGDGSLKKDVFGALTWSNAKYKVRSPIVISSETSTTN